MSSKIGLHMSDTVDDDSLSSFGDSKLHSITLWTKLRGLSSVLQLWVWTNRVQSGQRRINCEDLYEKGNTKPKTR